MAKPEPREWRAAGKLVTCPHCAGTRFRLRPTLMNTIGATLFNFDWANREAAALICEGCQRIEWFMDIEGAQLG